MMKNLTYFSGPNPGTVYKIVAGDVTSGCEKVLIKISQDS